MEELYTKGDVPLSLATPGILGSLCFYNDRLVKIYCVTIANPNFVGVMDHRTHEHIAYVSVAHLFAAKPKLGAAGSVDEAFERVLSSFPEEPPQTPNYADSSDLWSWPACSSCEHQGHNAGYGQKNTYRRFSWEQ